MRGKALIALGVALSVAVPLLGPRARTTDLLIDHNSPTSLGEIYAAALGGPPEHRQLQTAVDPALLHDDETETPDSLDGETIAYLLRRGFASEICGPGPLEYGQPTCLVASARWRLSLSRPVQSGRDTLAVLVGTASVQPGNGPSLVFPFATIERCYVVRRASAWVRTFCATLMIT